MTRSGFSLIELMIAATLAIAVMLAVVSLSTNVVRQHLQAVHKGEVSGASLTAMDRLNRDIQSATYLAIPKGTLPQGNTVGGCLDWSGSMNGVGTGGVYSTFGVGGTSAYFIYCVTGAGARFGSLIRYPGAGSPQMTLANCNAFPTVGVCGANASNGALPEVWVRGDGVNFGLSRGDNNPGYYFARSTDTDGVELHYILGNSTVTGDAASRPGQFVPQFYKVDTKIRMMKSYNNGAD